MAKKEKENQNLFQKLTRLFKSGPVVRRKIRTLDTTIAVPDKSKSSGALLFQKSMAPTYATITANAYNLSERLMRYQDFAEMEYCLHGDTKIAVPGGYRTLADLAVECEGRPDHTFIVYSYDHGTQRIVPAFGKQARQTRIDHAYTVTFDDGRRITGTPNHRLMKRDGTFCKIEDLKPGDAMMPFYRRDLFGGCREEGEGYRWIYTMDRRSSMNGWVAEHRVIGEMLKGSPLVEGEVVHHRNFVKHDNRPENLEVMTEEAHRRLHVEIINGAKWSEQNAEWIQRFKANHSKFMTDNNPAERKDITFGRILELAERTGFNSRRMCEALDTDPNVIKRRLRKHGYKDFETFAKAYNPDWHNAGWDNRGEKNPRYVRSITFDRICSNFSKGMSNQQLADSLGTTIHVVEGRIRERGYKNYSDFASSYDNLKVVSVEYHGVIPLYDLTVDGHKNFATDTVISHNTPELAAALDIYADETCAQDEKGRVLHIYSDNEKIKEILEDLFYNTLNVEFNLRSWVRNLVKYGDMFLYNDVSPTHGVINAFPIPVNEIEREENYDPNDPMAVRYRWVTLGNRTLENWEVTHFRLLGNDMFLPYGSSVIEPARRIWRQLILIEDAMLVYRVVRAPERRVFYIDVANIPPENVPMYVEEQKKQLRSSQVIDRNTGRVDLRYNPLPLSHSTLVPLLDGRRLTLKEMAEEYDAGKTNWVYSVKDGTNNFVPGKVVWCGKNYTADKLVRVWFTEDRWIDSAPEHPFMLRDGSKKRADELSVGDKLMPLYVKLSSKDEGDDIVGYPKVYNPGSGKHSFVHRGVANDVLREQRENVRRGVDWSTNGNLVVHHRDMDSLNSSPDNLVWMGNVDHIKFHASIGRENIIRYNKSPEKRRKTSELNKKRNAVAEMSWYNGNALHASHNDRRCQGRKAAWDDQEKRAVAQKNMRLVFDEKCLSIVVDAIKNQREFVGLTRLCDELRENAEFVSHYTKINETNNRDPAKSFHKGWLKKMLEQNDCEYVSLFQTINPAACTGANFARSKSSTTAQYKNHEVVKLTEVNGPLDVFCMTVHGPNGEHDRHNVAVVGDVAHTDILNESFNTGVQDGVIVGQSVDEDYFIPVRGGESGTRIDTLAGGQNAAAVEDVAYIQKKLFAALKIPRAYLGYDEALSSKATLAQEDIRFSRTINVIQKTMIAELNKLAIIHLFANGFDDEDLQNFALRLSNPSTVAQQQKLELWRAKFEIAGSAPEGQTSKEFIRKEIWGLNDEQCKLIDEQRLKEKMVDQAIESAEPGGAEAGGGEEPAGDEEAGGGEEAGGEEGGAGAEDLFAGDVPDGGLELITASDDPEDDDDIPAKLSISDVEVPVKARTQLDRALYNRGRIRHHGAAKTHMPDFGKMVSTRSKSNTDPYDREWANAYLRNPFGEAHDRSLEESRPVYKTVVGIDVMSALRNMAVSPKFKQAQQSQQPEQKVLTESPDEADLKEHQQILIIDDDGDDE